MTGVGDDVHERRLVILLGDRRLIHALCQHGALLHGDIAAAVAVGANLRRGTRLAAGAMAVRAALHPVDADFLLAAEDSLLKAQGHMDTQILTGNGGVRIGLTGGTAAEAAAEEG